VCSGEVGYVVGCCGVCAVVKWDTLLVVVVCAVVKWDTLLVVVVCVQW